mgnify:CR=1 FL=1
MNLNIRKLRKHISPFCKGRYLKNQGEIKKNIEGLSAITKYRVIQRSKDFTLVEVMPLTGRTNQIRIHFKEIGHPVVGETKYAFRRDFKLRAKRLCLHAKRLEFTHPITKKYIRIEADLPSDLKEFLNKYPS